MILFIIIFCIVLFVWVFIAKVLFEIQNRVKFFDRDTDAETFITLWPFMILLVPIAYLFMLSCFGVAALFSPINSLVNKLVNSLVNKFIKEKK